MFSAEVTSKICPFIDKFPYAVIVLAVVGILATYLFHRMVYGRQLLAMGDNPRAAKLSGVATNRVRILAFVISAVSAVIAGILLGGFSGVNIEAGTGLELQAISAAVLGGAVLLGGSGSVPAAMAGALALELLFALLNLLGLPKPLRDAVQGLIIIGAVAYAAMRHTKIKIEDDTVLHRRYLSNNNDLSYIQITIRYKQTIFGGDFLMLHKKSWLLTLLAILALMLTLVACGGEEAAEEEIG